MPHPTPPHASPRRRYRRRQPERGVLHGAVQQHLETFLAHQRSRHPEGAGVPRFVERELRAFLRCGLLSHGFARFRCGGCGAERLVAFSCKGRAVCPSCAGRRMTSRAADLVDRVLPQVRYRQWVLSLPFWLRWRCAWDHALTRKILSIFLRAVFRFHLRRAAESGVCGGRAGSVTAIQRFGGALNLNVHFHSLVPDGVWTEDPDGRLVFRALRPPTRAEVSALSLTIEHRVKRLLVRRGLWLDDDEEGGRPADAAPLPPLASLYEAAVTQRGADGEPLRRVGALTLEPATSGTLKQRTSRGFDLHADVAVRATDRARLEHLCRYLLRPPISEPRLAPLPGGDIMLKLKTRWADGTTHLRLSPQQLLERLAALIPRPRTNQLLYHGVFAANAKWRARIVPGPTRTHSEPAPPASRPNHTWAELMRRGLDIDSLECPRRCGQGRLTFIACIDQPSVIRKILEHLGLPAEPVAPAPARGPPTDDQLDWGA